MSLYAHIWLFIIYIQFAKSRFAPESRIPNSIGLAIYLGMLWEAFVNSLKKLIKDKNPWLSVFDAFELIKSKTDLESDIEIAELLKAITITDHCIPYDKSKTDNGNPSRLHRDYENKTTSDMDYLIRDLASGSIIINDIDLRFKNFVWNKSNFIFHFEHLTEIDLGDSETLTTPNTFEDSAPFFITDVLKEKRQEYCPLIYLLEDFANRFNLKINDLAFFLSVNNFSQDIFAYVNINKTDYIQLDKENSQKSINHLLNVFNDKKYNDNLLSVAIDDNINELDHIHLKTDDLYNFPPLTELNLDYCIGHEIFGSLNLKNIDYKNLLKIEEEYRDSQPKIFSDEWYDLHPKLSELKKMQSDASNIVSKNYHPSFDPSHPKFAPELLLAIQAWEAKYLNNEYPHMEHTPAIKAFLNKTGYLVARLQDRISAITNPKDINKSNN